MIRENLYYKILSAIHIVFFTSILCFGTIYITGTLLMIPALAASFLIGRDYLYKKLDVTSSIVKTYVSYLKASMRLLRFLPINLIMILNIVGMIFLAKAEYKLYAVLCLTITALLLLITLYIAGYYAFVSESVDIVEVIMTILLKPQYGLPVFCVIVIALCFVSLALGLILLVCGSFFLFALSILIFISMLHYKKEIGILSLEDEYYHLVCRK